MADFTLSSYSRYAQDDGAPYKTTVVANSTVNVKGAWVPLVASVPFDCDAVLFNVHHSTQRKTALLDIGVGAAGSEVVVLPDYMIQAGADYGGFTSVRLLPLQFKAGQQISVRCQSNAASADYYVKMHLLKGGFFGGIFFSQRAVTYGAGGAFGSGAVIVTASATANAKGPWVDITTATTEDHRGLLLNFGANNSQGVPRDFSFDIAIGTPEQIILPDLLLTAYPTNTVAGQTTNLTLYPQYPILPVNIPAGTRIAARCKCTAASGTSQLAITGF